MNKHEKAIKNLLDNDEVDRDYQYNYIRKAEATENKLHQVEIENITLKLYREKYIELQQDVKRYWELANKGKVEFTNYEALTPEEFVEGCELEIKIESLLSKVGIEEK